MTINPSARDERGAADSDVASLAAALDESARESGLHGAVSVDVDGEFVLAAGYGLADRRCGVPNTPDTRFATASATKSFTALAVMSLVSDGTLGLDVPVRSILGEDLPLVDDRVTVEHLLTHRSGIGDYIDESELGDIGDYLITVPMHELLTTEGFVPMLEGHEQKTAPGERFAYNNGGYVLLALVAERASGSAFHDLVTERVFGPAGLLKTSFLRIDELPGDAAIGYLGVDSDRTNVFHLPMRGNGDGGAYTTVGDLSVFWRAFIDGRIVDAATRDLMITPTHVGGELRLRYGTGFWLDTEGPGLVLDGYDAGVSIRSRFDPTTRMTVTIVSNTSEGAWPVVRRYREFREAH
ncbi:serine hydrolase domain-containing protein [Ruicaihuangia caeni]|uniref:serine hydrolase domain-containing protein n=1 Tax=Ruicaihuangia caeni TaxID=3042517 RepID=UPI0033901023